MGQYAAGIDIILNTTQTNGNILLVIYFMYSYQSRGYATKPTVIMINA